jgi:hypothetical protein
MKPFCMTVMTKHHEIEKVSDRKSVCYKETRKKEGWKREEIKHETKKHTQGADPATGLGQGNDHQLLVQVQLLMECFLLACLLTKAT